MTRYYPGTDITFELRYTDADDQLVSADTVTASYKLNDEDQVAIEAASITNAATGIYRTILQPKKSGVLRVFWTATKDNIVKTIPERQKIHETEFTVA